MSSHRHDRPIGLHVKGDPSGVKLDRSWMRAGMVADEFAKLEAENIDRPQVVKDLYGIQARNLARLNKAGMKIALTNSRPMT